MIESEQARLDSGFLAIDFEYNVFVIAYIYHDVYLFPPPFRTPM